MDSFITFLSFLNAAFTKMITINGQEYHLQLVDTAGQVRCISRFIDFYVNMQCCDIVLS